MSRQAMVLVDLQNDYLPGGAMELSGAAEAMRKAELALNKCRAADVPVVHIQHISTRPGATFFLPGTHGAEIAEAVRPVSGETIFQKHFPNSFRDTPLLEYLRGVEAERLILCGMMTHMCVDTTVRAAFDLGFPVTLAHDACATRDLLFDGESIPAASVHNTFLAALNGMFARLVTAEELQP